MEALPREISDQLCSYLDRPALASFSLVNKACLDLATPWIFRSVVLKPTSSEDLATALVEWTRILERRSSLRYVRCLQIGPDSKPYGSDNRDDLGDRVPATWTRQFGRRTDISEWSALADFIQRLEGLADVTWALNDSFPDCVLKLILGCRLHLHDFCSRSLIVLQGGSLIVSEDDLKVLTSPCLYSISLGAGVLRARWDEADHHKEAVLCVLSLATNLQKLYADHYLGRGIPRALGIQAISEQMSQVINSRATSPARKQGGLTSLILFNAGPIDTFLKPLSLSTDFALLHTLKLYHGVHPNHLLWLSHDCHLSSLHTLAIGLESDEHTDLAYAELEAAADKFLRSLPLLRSISVTGQYFRSVVDCVLEHHGPTLKEFRLSNPYVFPDEREDLKFWILSKESVLTICLSCPSLEALALPLQRSRGHAAELASYHSLGQCRKLHDIQLNLYGYQDLQPRLDYQGSNATVDDSREGNSDFYKDEDLRDVLVNITIDENLSREIFHTIDRSKSAGSVPLQRLDLITVPVSSPHELHIHDDFARLSSYLARNWTCERGIEADEVVVRQSDIAPLLPNVRDSLDSAEGLEDLRTIMTGQTERVFRSIWPATGKDWWEEWRSVPLASTVDSIADAE
ncbi:hypothetical protein ANO11243_083250 [Dothideomycetidae sp. 11243]|nr:hypothetical protein ANO11243_083250 [fungal sp. No.11243]